MKPILSTLLSIALGAVALGASAQTDFYLHASMGSGSNRNVSPLDGDLWFTSPVVGEGPSKTQTGIRFHRNNFNPNGFQLRTQNNTRRDGENTFPGRLIIDHRGIESLQLLTGRWKIPLGLQVGSEMLVRLRRPSSALAVMHDLTIAAGGEMIFATRPPDDNESFQLEVENLLGEGTIAFGGVEADDSAMSWRLDVTTGADFAGNVVVRDGQLTLASDLNLPTARFAIEETPSAKVVLNAIVTVGELRVGASTLDTPGDFRVSDLGARFGNDRFSGSGTLRVKGGLPAAAPSGPTETPRPGGGPPPEPQ